jgi:hypothetical protein
MVPLRRLWSSSHNIHVFTANNEDANWWIKEQASNEEFIVGFVYRRDGPCPDGAVPLYHVCEPKLGRLLTISKGERASCLRLGGRDEGIQCYVSPP